MTVHCSKGGREETLFINNVLWSHRKKASAYTVQRCTVDPHGTGEIFFLKQAMGVHFELAVSLL